MSFDSETGIRLDKNNAIGSNRIASLALILLSVLIVVLLSVFAQKQVLNYSFVGTDTLTLIDSSRLDSLADIKRVFSNPTMFTTSDGQTQFWNAENRSLFYRPVSALSYSLDYKINGLEPAGYHWTDMFLHVSVVLLVYLLIALLAESKICGFIAASLFAIHPIILENLSASSRRQDILATLFMLLVFVLFIKSQRAKKKSEKRIYLTISLFVFLLGLGTQEIVFILPFVLLAYLVIYSNNSAGLFKRLWLSLKKILYFLIAIAAAFIWRLMMLRGVGGYATVDHGLFAIIKTIPKTLYSYFSYLLFPGGIAGAIYEPFPGTLSRIISILLLFVLILTLFLNRRSISTILGRGRMYLINLVFAVAGIFSLTMIIIYPLIAVFIRDHNNVIIRFADALNVVASPTKYAKRTGISLQPDVYYNAAKNAAVAFAAFAFFVSLISLAAINSIHRLKNYKWSKTSKLTVFLCLWLILPLFLFILTGTLSPRETYIYLTPFCAIVALLVLLTFRLIKREVFSEKNVEASGNGKAVRLTGIGGLLLSILLLSFVPSSPLFKTNEGWRDNSDFTRKILEKIEVVANEASATTTLHITNMPAFIADEENKFDQPRQNSFPSGYTLASWLHLVNPERHLRVSVDTRLLPHRPRDFELIVDSSRRNEIDIDIQYQY